MTKDKKYCPLKDAEECYKGECAWFVSAIGGCAVPTLTATVLAVAASYNQNDGEDNDDD